jgi:hypothetical protein
MRTLFVDCHENICRYNKGNEIKPSTIGSGLYFDHLLSVRSILIYSKFKSWFMHSQVHPIVVELGDGGQSHALSGLKSASSKVMLAKSWQRGA